MLLVVLPYNVTHLRVPVRLTSLLHYSNELISRWGVFVTLATLVCI